MADKIGGWTCWNCINVLVMNLPNNHGYLEAVNPHLEKNALTAAKISTMFFTFIDSYGKTYLT